MILYSHQYLFVTEYMLFVHLAREELVISCDGVTEYIPYIDLERVLPAKIVACVERFAPTSCCVINGP